MKHDKCICWDNETGNRCRKPTFAVLKVKVFHPDSLRKSTQTWYMCKQHFLLFIKDKGKNWFCRYRNKKKEDAPIIDYEII